MPVAPGSLTILYDADCSLCQDSKKRLEAIDKTGVFQWVPLQDPSIAERFPDIPPWQMKVSMHVIDAEGRIFKGAAAFREMGRRVSAQSFLGMAFKLYYWASYLPGFLWLAERIYSGIAQNRYKL